MSAGSTVRNWISNRKRKVQILQGIDGVLESGEMLVVLGPPGSECSTFLKAVAGETNGIYLDDGAELIYLGESSLEHCETAGDAECIGISGKQMANQFRGEAIYTAVLDVHFPKLIVGDTLQFAAEARAPRMPPGGLTQIDFACHLRDVVMVVFGISHTVNTIVGDDFVRGVSGGE